MDKEDSEYELDPRLLVYPCHVGGRRVFAASADSSTVPIILESPLVLSGLLRFGEVFTQEIAEQAWVDAGLSASVAHSIFTIFATHEIIRPIRHIGGILPAKAEWLRHGWQEAFAYHFSTRDYPFVKMDSQAGFDEDATRMAKYATSEPPPSIYQEFHASDRIMLSRIGADGPEKALLNMTREQARSVEGLSLLFDLCFGERGRKDFGHQGELIRKSIPSGGSRHPTEVFFVSLCEDTLPLGIYHYNVQRHCLDMIKTGDQSEEFAKATFDLFKKYSAPPFGLLLFTSVIERAMWRYRDPRSFRAIPIDIGHAVMAFRVASGRLGISHYTYQKFNDRMISMLVGIDPLRQPVFYVATLVRL